MKSDSGSFNSLSTRTYGVDLTGSAGFYHFHGDIWGTNPTLGARVGDTLNFEVSALSTQPLRIKTAFVTQSGDNNASGVTNNGASDGTIIWDTTGLDAGTYYYISENSYDYGGEIILGPAINGTLINGRGLDVTGSIILFGGQEVTGSLKVKGYADLSGSVTINGKDVGTDLFTLTGSEFQLPFYPNFNSAVSDIQITGSLMVSSSLSASLPPGYVWVGGENSMSIVVPTSSLVTAPQNEGIFVLTGSAYNTTNDLIITGSFTVLGETTITGSTLITGSVSISGSLSVQNTLTASGFSVNSTGLSRLSSTGNLNLESTNGAVVIVTSSLRLSQFSDAQTSSLVAINGDIIYNTTVNKFVGYANGTWVELH